LKINYVLLAPWIILSLPPSALSQQSILVVVIVTIVGLLGMVLGNKTAIVLASVSLLLLIIWGKIASDINKLAQPDSALLLLQFLLVIFLMEASTTALTFGSTMKKLEGKKDDISAEARMRAIEWGGAQLFSLGKLTVAAFGLSLGLLIIGSIISVSFNQLAFSGILVLASVIVIFILLTYGREPESRNEITDQFPLTHSS